MVPRKFLSVQDTRNLKMQNWILIQLKKSKPEIRSKKVKKISKSIHRIESEMSQIQSRMQKIENDLNTMLKFLDTEKRT
jgi:hypothetical protein